MKIDPNLHMSFTVADSRTVKQGASGIDGGWQSSGPQEGKPCGWWCLCANDQMMFGLHFVFVPSLKARNSMVINETGDEDIWCLPSTELLCLNSLRLSKHLACLVEWPPVLKPVFITVPWCLWLKMPKMLFWFAEWLDYHCAATLCQERLSWPERLLDTFVTRTLVSIQTSNPQNNSRRELWFPFQTHVLKCTLIMSDMRAAKQLKFLTLSGVGWFGVYKSACWLPFLHDCMFTFYLCSIHSFTEASCWNGSWHRDKWAERWVYVSVYVS